jgi:ABC-2 type transport system ATP-binding protein
MPAPRPSLTATTPPAGARAATTTTAAAIRATDLQKTYGKGEKAVAAVAGISLTVPAGTVFGLLGPNGAGKSTIVKLLTTLARPDSGTAEVAGVDVLRDPAEVRRRIGYVSQKPGFDPVGTGRENLILQGRVYGLRATAARRRADALLERFGLTAAAHRLLRTWSGGMQRKLDVAMGLIHQPDVLFLDEPTNGLDPQARADMWSEIAELADDGGLTVLLTTHYLQEADRLAGHLVIIDTGRVVAAGTPDGLKDQLHGDSVQIGLAARDVAQQAVTVLAGIDQVSGVSADGTRVRARVTDGARALPALIAALDAAGIRVLDVTVARPSLDDVYLRYAGRSFRSAEHHAGPREADERVHGAGDGNGSAGDNRPAVA